MTKLQTLLTLLGQGSLSYPSIREITGWSPSEIQGCIDSAVAAGAVRRTNNSNGGSGGIRYALTAA